MKMKEALKIIDDNKKTEAGFMVAFEKKEKGILASDHFPDKHAGELLLKTEEFAWKLAEDFANVSDNYVNICVIDSSFTPINNCGKQKLNKY